MEDLVKLRDAAARLGVSTRTVRRLITNRRVLPFYKIGAAIRIAVADLEKFLADAKREAP